MEILNFISTYLFPLMLLILSVWFMLVQPESNKQQAAIKILGVEIPLLRASRGSRTSIQVSGMILLVAGVAWIGLIWRESKTQNVVIPNCNAHLTSVGYLVDDWDPRLIDLRRVETEGIPAPENQSLQFFDLWVASSSENGCKVSVEVLVGDNSIGRSAEQFVAAGQPVNLKEIEVTGYEHPAIENAWQIQPSWKEVSLVLHEFVDGQPVAQTQTKIKFDRTGKAWFVAPPNASLIQVAYRINAEPETIMDLSQVMQNGLGAEPGDTLTITRAWYKSNLSNTESTVQLEAYLGSGTYDPQTLKVSQPLAIREGVNTLGDVSALSWAIPEDKESLVMTLGRGDQTVLDRYTIPLEARQSSGLVPLTNAVQWHFSEFTYFDFEQGDDVMGWESTENTAVRVRDEYAFSGSHALAVGNKMSESQVWAIRRVPFRASYIIGQVYWPKTENISVSWAQVCLGGNVQCVSISAEPGQWNPFLIDLQQIKDADGIPYSEKEIPDIFFQGAFNGVSQENQYLFYIDGIQIYPVKTP